ncbi:ATP-binding protein [Acinetobacter guillouiae]|uniref:Uncharacterized protein n=1 Tax=Acinetobacter guillouiae NIPH 991 TaxID=1217656 RepID=N8YA14_ACIGI|nr:ATP-binding protein [Acinetobacter guillouiae]ENV16180.1 hypothetical protein F964_03115 [Acinetobacter guillouiae NIPH 991]
MNNTNQQAITKGLKNIYLHNSYIRNKRVKLQCDGHTNLIGGNGRGKTSMLNLLPVFAGISPERMVQKAGNKSSFLDFYLPNLQSMIVYEYIGYKCICCVVIYRHQNGNKLIYRFVQGSAETTFFAPQFHELFEKNTPVNELIHELQLNDIKVSKQLETVLDYRAILHNDKDRFAYDKTLRNLAAEYAMCERQYTLRHLGELTRVPMSQTDLINKFKSMLVDAYLQDENAVARDKGLTHTGNLSLIEDIKSLREFIKESPQLEKGTQLRANVIQTFKQLLKLKIQGQALSEQFEEDENKLQQNHDIYIQQYEQDFEAIQKTVTDLATQLSSKQGERTTVKKQIEHINQKEQEYQKLNINRMISEYNDLPTYQTRVQEEKIHLQRLEASAKELLESHDQHVRQVQDETDQENRLLEQKKLFINHQQVELLKQQSTEEDSLRITQQQQSDALSDKQELALQTIYDNIQQANRSVGAAEAYTAEEQQHLDLNKRLLKQQKQQISEHSEKHKVLVDKIDQQKKKVTHAVTTLENHKNLLNKERDQERELREQLHSEGSLISFLRSHHNDAWKLHIGKLINPSLLLTQGLNPKWDTDELSQNSFYGLHLDVEKLSLPQEADTLDELKARIDQHTLRCNQYQSDLSILERKLTLVKAELNDLEIERTVSEQDLNNLNTKNQELEAKQESTEKQIRLNVNERRERATQLLQDAQQQQKSLIQQHKDAKHNLQRIQEETRSHVKAKYQLKYQQLLEEIQQIEINILQVIKQGNDKTAELISAKNRVLQAEGLDTEQLKNAEQRLAKAQQLLEIVNGYIGIINAYRKWFDTEFSQCNDLLFQLKILQEAIENLEKDHIDRVKDLGKLDLGKSEYNKQYQATLKVIQRQSQQLDNLVKRLEPPLSEFNELKLELDIGQPEKPLDFDWYINYGQEQLTQLSELRRESFQLHSLVKQILSLAQGNGLERYWSNQMMDSPYQVDSLPYMLQAMSVLNQMLEHEIPSKIYATIMAYQSLGIVFRNHYDSLKQFQRKVSRVSDNLSSNINTHNPFTSLSDIEICLEATINKFGYLTDLENFVNKFEADVNELPNENVVALLEDAVKALHNSNVENHDLTSMVEMSICFRENTRLVRVKNDRDLAEASSTGLSRLVILLIFTGLIRHLCADDTVAIHLPIDELGQIDPSNSIKLLDLMQQQQVHLVCAQPQMNEEIGKSFKYKYNIDKDKGVSQFVMRSKTQQNPLLVTGRNAG